MTIHSYPSVFALGHKAIEGIFNGPVVIEEKVDGSQFSFGMIDGELECRSKGKQLFLDAPEKMFTKAVETARALAPILVPNYVYRGEFLASPKHNSLCYDRTPKNHIILFDVTTGLETYMQPDEMTAEAERIGLESVPVLFTGEVSGLEMFNEFLQRVSILGGCKVEGAVVKNYSLFTMEKKVAMGKYVSEAFKEIHAGEWKKMNPTGADFVDQVIDKYKTPARWQKAVQHLREDGILEGTPRDIGNLLKAAQEDIEKECADEIKELLYTHFWPQIRRGVVSGLPEWYKQELAKSAFDNHE